MAATMRTSTRIAFGLAEPLDLPLLEHAQQLHLDVGRQVADLVEEDRRAIGQLEASDLPRERAGEGAFLAAEQLALDQGRGNRRAVHAHHRRRRRRARFVKVRGEELLAGAGLAEEQHRRVRGRHLLQSVPARCWIAGLWPMTACVPGSRVA